MTDPVLPTPPSLAMLGVRGIPAHYGGFETCVDHTSRLLTQAGWQVTVFNRSQHFDQHPATYEGVQLRYVPRPQATFLHTIGHSMRCAYVMRQEHFDLVHLYGVGNAFAIPLLQWGGRKVVISVDAQDWARDKWGVVGRNYLLLAARFAVRIAQAVIVDSQAIGDFYQQTFKSRTHYIAYGAETTLVAGKKWLDQFNLQPNQYHLFVGRLTPEKRPHLLIKAYQQLHTTYPLVIVGDNPYNPDYVAYLHSLASEKVRFVGTVYDDGFHQLCRYCYLYLTASAIEGTSPALLQAMGQGAAVLVNGIPANRETIGQAGFAYQANEEADLIQQWQHLIDHPAQVQAIRPQAIERIHTYYTWKRVTKQLSQLYKTVLSA